MDEELRKLAEDYFPPRLKKILLADARSPEKTEEIRLISGRGLSVMKKSGLYFMDENGISTEEKTAATVSREEVQTLLDALCRHSVYSCQEQLRQGFLPLSGGHRAGVAGRCVLENGQIRYVTDVSAIHIRVAHEVIGAAKALVPYYAHGRIRSTLILSPPGCGKTTMLRDLSRIFGGERFMKKVAIVDERSELAACVDGIPTNDVGPLTVVMDNCPKHEGIMTLLRATAPDVIVTDEIGSEEDCRAILKAASSGVSVITSVHGDSPESLSRRAPVRELIEEGVFGYLAVLSHRAGAGTLEKVVSLDA